MRKLELDSLSHPEEPSLNHNLALVCVGQGSSTTVNPPRLPLADDIVESVGQNNPPIIDPISNTEATTPNRTLSQRVLDRRPLRANESFEETVIRMLVEIKSDVRDLLRRGNINQEDISTKYKDIPVELPVSSEDELGTLEQWILRNGTNRNVLVSYLAEFGGKTGAAEITRGVLKELFGPTVARRFNYTGGGTYNKRAFSTSILHPVVIDAIKRSNDGANADLSFLHTIILNWFKNSRDQKGEGVRVRYRHVPAKTSTNSSGSGAVSGASNHRANDNTN
ncbi:hypothetical protein Fcan01_08772 [Folsomia candida]|uniref:DUF4806 domain-containing protein n=1 Tax=Folsomia candida TaxID=158441 RepID=A0A226EE72_FOLCA|nr:hypothetical protein Fcan01_08772 [Folsomia candida]